MLTRKDLEKLEIGKDVLVDSEGREYIYFGISPTGKIFAHVEDYMSGAYNKSFWKTWTIKKKTKKKTKKVKLLGYISQFGIVIQIEESRLPEFDVSNFKRIINKDEEVEVEE